MNEEFEQELWEEEDGAPLPPSLISLTPRFDDLLAILSTYCFIVILTGSFWKGWLPNHWMTGPDIVFKHGHWHSLFTSLFLHSDIGHLLANTPMFLVFGYFLHGYFGRWVFPLSCILMGAVANYLALQFMVPQGRLLGASGMVYAMEAMWLVVYLRFETRFKFRTRLMRALAFCLIIMAPTSYRPNVSYAAHGAGFLVGILFGLALVLIAKPQVQTVSEL